jgi:hypothetical protein
MEKKTISIVSISGFLIMGNNLKVTTVLYVVAAGTMMPGTCGLLSVTGTGPTTAATTLASALPESRKKPDGIS